MNYQELQTDCDRMERLKIAYEFNPNNSQVKIQQGIEAKIIEDLKGLSYEQANFTLENVKYLRYLTRLS